MKVLYIASLLHLVQFQITFMRKSTQQMMFLIELNTLKSVKLYALPLKKRDQRQKKRNICVALGQIFCELIGKNAKISRNRTLELALIYIILTSISNDKFDWLKGKK